MSVNGAALLTAALLLIACNRPAPARPGDDPTAHRGADPDPTLAATDADVVPPTPAEQTTTPTPLPDPPTGWAAYESPELRLSLYVPPGWEIVPVSPAKLDLRQTGADGWVEINTLNEANAFEWSLVYTPGMDGQAILETLLTAAREDGMFDAPRSTPLRTGMAAWLAEGTYEPLSDHVLIGVIGLPERALILIGHAPNDEDGWDAGLITMYQTIMWTIQPR